MPDTPDDPNLPILPDPTLPTLPTPDPLTPSEQRARRMLRREIIKRSQAQGYLPATLPLPPRGGMAPAGKLFELETLKRVKIIISPNAQAALTRSSAEGRRFSLALQEIFAQHEPVVYLELTLDRKGDLFADHPSPDDLLLTLTIYEHGEQGDDQFVPTPVARYHLNLTDTQQLHPATREPLFNALATAGELYRVYLAQRLADTR